jgi:phospholipase/carboxylesterase
MSENPHRTVPIMVEGAPLDRAPLALVMVHGRSLSAAYMRENVAARLDRADLAHILPEAHENSWYPESFLRPIEVNQPRLDWALERLEDVRQLLADAGVEDERIVWLGFSQGGCLVSEYVARSSRRFGAMVCFTGGLIGPTEQDLARPTAAHGLPALFMTSDIDEFVPLWRVQETVAIYRSAGAAVELGISLGAAHEIVDDAMERCRALLDALQPHATTAATDDYSSPPVA